MARFDFLKKDKKPTATASSSTSAHPTPRRAATDPLADKTEDGSAAAPPKPPTIAELTKTMCPRKAVHWAMESAKMGGPPLNAGEHKALQATEAWLKHPTPQTQAAAAEAAMKSGHGGPGGWAAQAAAWSGGHTGGASGTVHAIAVGLPKDAAGAVTRSGGAAPGGGSLAGLAVAGSVALSAALKAGLKIPTAGAPTFPPLLHPIPVPPPPSDADLAKAAEIHKPFIELGQKIAADPTIKC